MKQPEFFYYFCAFIIILLILTRLFRPKRQPEPPPSPEIMAQREAAFEHWLAVLYRDNPSAKAAVLANLPTVLTDFLEDGERIGTFDADTALWYMAEAFDEAHLSSVYWDLTWQADSLSELNDNLLPLCQRFGFAPPYQDYREDDWRQERDTLPIQPILRWLAAEFFKHGAMLSVNVTFDNFYLLFAMPMADADDFQAACHEWGLTMN